mgnify:CR=1 FL=1
MTAKLILTNNIIGKAKRCNMATNFFRLDGLHDTLVLYSELGRLPRLLYWGSVLPQSTCLASLAMATERPVPHGGLDQEEVVSWLPEPGRGFTDAPGLVLRRGSCGLYTQLRIVGARQLPQGWEIECADERAQIQIVLRMSMDPTTHCCPNSLAKTPTNPLSE